MAATIHSLLAFLDPFVEVPRSEARDLILAVAIRYQDERRIELDAPRLSQLRDELNSIADSAAIALSAIEALAVTLSGASRWAQDQLLADDILSLNLRQMSALDRDPLDAFRIRAGLMDDDWSIVHRDPLVGLVDTLQNWPEATRIEGIRALAKAIAADIPSDKGGGGNIWIGRWGSARWTVAQEGFDLFARCRGSDRYPMAGDMLSFVGGLLEFASDDQESGDTIGPYLRRVVAWNRRYWEIQTELRSVSDQLGNRSLAREERQLIAARMVDLQRQLNEHMPRNLREKGDRGPGR